jgi:hypothetical protein
VKIRKNDNQYGEKKNVKKLSKNLQEAYKNDLELIDNIIIFTEFLKEFVSIILHKVQFENIVEEFYGLYSQMLDDFNHVNDKRSISRLENVRNSKKEVFIENLI